jgi:hypothetical protein
MEERIKELEAAMMGTQKQQRVMAEMIEKQWEAIDEIIKQLSKSKDRILLLEIEVYKSGKRT